MSAGRGSSSIVALDWNKEGAKLWEQESSKLDLPNRRARSQQLLRTVSFEGTPVGDAAQCLCGGDRSARANGHVCRLLRRRDRRQPLDSLLGHGLVRRQNNFRHGHAGWACRSVATGPGDFNHRLLSLDGPALYYQTNLGAVVALEAETGATLWVATYPRTRDSSSRSRRASAISTRP